MPWSKRMKGDKDSYYGTIPAESFSFLLLLSSSSVSFILGNSEAKLSPRVSLSKQG